MHEPHLKAQQFLKSFPLPTCSYCQDYEAANPVTHAGRNLARTCLIESRFGKLSTSLSQSIAFAQLLPGL